MINPQYLSLYSTHYVAQCPILDFQIKDGTGNALSTPSIYLTNPGNPPTARIDVKKDIAFT